MEEARRFLRYIVPGLVYGTQTLVLLFILVPWWTWARVQELGGDTGFGLAVTVLLASGGVGFVFSTVHHDLHWCPSLTAVDHRPIVRFLQDTQTISVKGLWSTLERSGETEVQRDQINSRHAWVLITSIWYQRTKTSEEIKAADPRSVGITDAMHSLGTARVASAAAWASALWIAASVSQFSLDRWLSFVAANALAAALLTIFQKSYKRTGSLAQGFISSVLADSLLAAQPGQAKPITAHLEVAPPAASDSRQH
jgi:hypothetical protein